MLNESPLVTVALITSKNIEHNQRALASVREQNYTHLEILVIDDATEDGSRQMLHHFANQDERITIIRNPEFARGLVANIHMILDEFRGDYLLLLRGDDFLEPDCIEKAIIDLQSTADAQVWYCHYQKQSAVGTELTDSHKAPRQEKGLSFIYHYLTAQDREWCLSAMMFSRQRCEKFRHHRSTSALFPLYFVMIACFDTKIIWNPKRLTHQTYKENTIGYGLAPRDYIDACAALINDSAKTQTMNNDEKLWLKKCMSYHAIKQSLFLIARMHVNIYERWEIYFHYCRRFFPECFTNAFTFSINLSLQHVKHTLQHLGLWRHQQTFSQFTIQQELAKQDFDNKEEKDVYEVKAMMLSVLNAMAKDENIELWGNDRYLFACDYFTQQLKKEFEKRQGRLGKITMSKTAKLPVDDEVYLVSIINSIMKSDWLWTKPQRALFLSALKIRQQVIEHLR